MLLFLLFPAVAIAYTTSPAASAVEDFWSEKIWLEDDADKATAEYLAEDGMVQCFLALLCQ